ncbi:MAG: hypothetical protein NVS1B12_11160 [Acidimicrobiales bacterium]
MRRRPVLAAALSAALSATVWAGAGAPAHAGGRPGIQGATTVLAGDVLPGLRSLASVATPASTPMQVGVILANPHAADLDRAYATFYTPGSPGYHQFLSADEVARAFGAPASAADEALRWSTRAGLRSVFATPTHDFLLLQGSAGQVERTFGVRLRTFADKATPFVANVNPPTVPTSVEGVIGLNTKLGFHPATRRAKPAQDTCVGTACVGLTTPQDLWSIYDQPTALSDANADFGQGQQMGIIGAGAVAGVLTDLRAFEKQFRLPQIPITVHSIGDDFKDESASIEWDLDTQASTGMAPKALGETLYFAKDLSDSSVLADIAAWSSDRNGPMQASASLGECEQDPTSTAGDNDTPNPVFAGAAGVAFVKATERALEQAAVQGKTLFASTGDSGSSCPLVSVNLNGVANQAFPETSYPASSRYAVAVGGTVLYGTPNTATAPASNAKRLEEYAWTFGGGGNTLYIPEPSYQKGISLLDNQRCVAQPNGTPYLPSAPACRGVPDVAAQSGDLANGYSIIAGAVPTSGAGTSLSSPLWLGMWTRIQAAAPITKAGYTLGFANETLYRIGKNAAQDVKAFFDVGGAQNSLPAGNGYYVTLPRSPLDPSGWDYVSGLGSPDVIGLGRAATGNATLRPTNPLPVPPPSDCGQAGLPRCRQANATSGCIAGGWTNPPHTATDVLGNADPQLSLAAGNMTVSRDGRTLDVTLTLEDLTPTVPRGATGAAWYATWVWKGVTYFAATELGVDGSLAYSDGTFANHQYSSAHADTGAFRPGSSGTITVHVPFTHVGSPGRGSTLSQPAAETFTEEGVPPTAAGGGPSDLAKVDTGGPGCPFVT